MADPVPAESTVEGQEAEAEDNNSSNNGGWTKSGSRFQFLNPAKRMSGKNTTTKSQAGAKGRFSSARGSGSGEEIVNRMRALQPQQLLMQPPRTRFRSSRAPTVATIADGEPSDQKQVIDGFLASGPGGDRRSPPGKKPQRRGADRLPNAVEPFLSTDSSDDSPAGSLFSSASSVRRLGPRRKFKSKKGGSQLGLDASGCVDTSAVIESYMPASLPTRRRPSTQFRNEILHQASFGSSSSMVAGGTRDVPYLARSVPVRSRSSFRLHTAGSTANLELVGEGGERANRPDDEYVDTTDVADDRPHTHLGAAVESPTEDGYGNGGVGSNGRRKEYVRARSTEAMIISSISRSNAKAAAAREDTVQTTTTGAATSRKSASEEHGGAGEEGIGLGRKKRDAVSSTLPATARLIAAAAAIGSHSAMATATTETTTLPTSTIAPRPDMDPTSAVGEISDDKRDAPTPTIPYYTPQRESTGGKGGEGHASENFIASGASTSKDFQSQSFPASPSDAVEGVADVGGGVSGGGVLEAYRSAISSRGGGFGRSKKSQSPDVTQANQTGIRPASTMTNAKEPAPAERRRPSPKLSDSYQEQAGLGELGRGWSGLGSRHSSKSKLSRMDSLLQMADVLRKGSHSEVGSNRGSGRRRFALEDSLAGGGRGGGQQDQLDGAFDYDQQGLGSDGEEVDEAFNVVFSQMMRADAVGSKELAFENAMGIMGARQMDEGLVGEEQFEEARARQDGHHDADNDDDDHDDRDGNGAEGDEVIFVWDRLAEGDGAGVDDILASNHPADDGVDDRQQLRRRRSDGQLMNGGHLRGDSWWREGAEKALADKRGSKTSNATTAVTPPIQRKVRGGHGKDSGSGRWTSGAGSSPGSTISAQEQAKRDWERKNGIRGGGTLGYAFRQGSNTSGRTSSWGLSDAHSATDGTATKDTGKGRSGRRTRHANSSEGFTADGERKGNGSELPSGTSDWSEKEDSESSPLSTESSDFLTSTSSQQSSGARGADEGGDGGGDGAGDGDDFPPAGLPPPSPSGSEEDQDVGNAQVNIAGASEATETSSSTTNPPGRKPSTGRRHSILWGDFTVPVKQKPQNQESTHDTKELAQKSGERAEPQQPTERVEPAEVASPKHCEAHAGPQGRVESQGQQERGEEERLSTEAGKLSNDQEDPAQIAVEGAPACPVEMAQAALAPDGDSGVPQEQKQQRPANEKTGQPEPVRSGATEPRTDLSKRGELSASALQTQKLDPGKPSKLVKRPEPQEQPQALQQQTDTGTSDEGPVDFEKRRVWGEAIGAGRAAVGGGGSRRRGSGSSGGGRGTSTDGEHPSQHPARLVYGLKRPAKVPGKRRFRRGGSMPDDLGGYALTLDGGGGSHGEEAGGGGQEADVKGVESCAGAMGAASRKWDLPSVLPPTELAPTKPQHDDKHAIAAASEWSSLQRSPSFASSSRRDSQNWPDDEVVNYSSQHTASGSSNRRLSPAGFAHSPGHHVFSSGEQRQHALQKHRDRQRREREDAEQAITTKGEEQRSNEEARNPKPLETTPAAAAPAAATALATTTTKTTAGRPRRPLVVPPLPRVLYHPLPNDTSSRPSAARRIATNDDNASVAIVDGKPQLTISKPPLTSRPPRAARCVTEGSSQQSHESQASSRGLNDGSKSGTSGSAPPSAASTSTGARTTTRAHPRPQKLRNELKQQARCGKEDQHGASDIDRSMNDGEVVGEASWFGPEDGRGRDGGQNVDRRESRSLSPGRQRQQGHKTYVDQLRAGESTRNSRRGNGLREGSNRSLSLSSVFFSTNGRAAPDDYERALSTSHTNHTTKRSSRSNKGTTGVARVCAALSVPWIGRGRSNRNRNQGKGKIAPGEADDFRFEGGEDEGYYGDARAEATPGSRGSTRSSTRSHGIKLRRRRHTVDGPPSAVSRAKTNNASSLVEGTQLSGPPTRRPQSPAASAAGVSIRSTGLNNDAGIGFHSWVVPPAGEKNSIDFSSSSSGLRWLNPMGQEGRGAVTATGVGLSRLLGVPARVNDPSALDRPMGVSTFEDEEEEAQRRMETLLMRSQVHTHQNSVTGGKSGSHQPSAGALPAAQAAEGVIPVRRRQ